MNATATLPRHVLKEVRALLLPWLACAAVMLAPTAMTEREPLLFLSGFAYFLGASSLGASSIGHEYTHRTLGLLLCLPARRERLLFIKLTVLATMLLGLWIIAVSFVFRSANTLTALPVVCAFFLAPWLTMACRSQVTGTLLTMVIPAGLAVGGALLGLDGLLASGFGMETLWTTLFWGGALGVCAVGAIASWRLFMRLEAIDSPGQDVGLPAWLHWRSAVSPVAPPFTKRNPVWLLVKKELHLHAMPLVLAGLYLLVWLAVAASGRAVPNVDDAFTLLTWFYVGLLALLIGSLASASERELGTLSWQLLMPLAASRQWAVKVGVAVSLGLLLGLGLPAVCAAVTPGLDPTPFLRPEPALAIVLLITGSLYISSVCTSSFRALLMSLPTALFVVPFRLLSVTRTSRLFPLLVVTGFVVLLLWFALVNHRRVDQTVKRVGMQVLTIVAWVEGVLLLTGVGAFHS